MNKLQQYYKKGNIQYIIEAQIRKTFNPAEKVNINFVENVFLVRVKRTVWKTRTRIGIVVMKPMQSPKKEKYTCNGMTALNGKKIYSRRGGKWQPAPVFCLGNSTDSRTYWGTVYRLQKSQT